MGKRYYCDYCDRSFIDDKESRRKHITGSMHMRLKKEHYNSFRSNRTILAEESAKMPCKRFHNTGECPFGANCRYSHFSRDDLDNLQYQIAEEERGNHMRSAELPSECMAPTESGEVKKEERKAHTWQVPAALQNYSNLPPSLRPIDFNRTLEIETWG